VERNLVGFQALAKGLSLFARRLQLVSRPGVFKVFDTYLPQTSFELVSSTHFPIGPSVLYLLQVRSGRWFEFNGYMSVQNGIRATWGLPVSDR